MKTCEFCFFCGFIMTGDGELAPLGECAELGRLVFLSDPACSEFDDDPERWARHEAYIQNNFDLDGSPRF